MLSLDTLISKLREDYGFGDATLFTDDKLTEKINDAIKIISQYYPALEMAYLMTIADQTRYKIEHTNLIGLKKVYYSIRETSELNLLDPGSTYQNSSNLARIMNMEIASKLSPSDGQVVSHDTFDLIPTPTEAIKVYYEYKRIRNISEIPDQFEEDLLNLIVNKHSRLVYKKTQINSGSSNPYAFDRRGSVTEKSSTTKVDMEKSFKTEYDDIISSIRAKVMKL